MTKPEAVYIALSSILFCLGEQASESARTAVIGSRPAALIRRFKIREEDQVLLPEKTAGPNREFLESIYKSFANYAEVRAKIVSFFLALSGQGQHLPIHLEIMMTNFRLMRGAGITHLVAITKLAKLHPWTLRIPELQPHWIKLMEDLKKFALIEERLRPYHRLLVPRHQYLFLPAELRPLIAVAGALIKEVEKTFSGYLYNKNNYQGLINKVLAMAPNYKPTSSLSKLATMLRVSDVELPSGHAPGMREDESVI